MVHNFVYIRSLLCWDYVMYIDVSRALSKEIFEEFGLNVKYKLIAMDQSSRYYWVMCRIRSKDSGLFFNSMLKLDYILRNSGYSDYREYCKRFEDFMNSDTPITVIDAA